jgi:hypothetical protein
MSANIQTREKLMKLKQKRSKCEGLFGLDEYHKNFGGYQLQFLHRVTIPRNFPLGLAL